jgi:hypothetical protein
LLLSVKLLLCCILSGRLILGGDPLSYIRRLRLRRGRGLSAPVKLREILTDNSEIGLAFGVDRNVPHVSFGAVSFLKLGLKRDVKDKLVLARWNRNNFKEDLKIVPTLSLTFDDLIQKYDVKKVDVLMTDVEGYDLDLLKTFPFNNIKPKVIIAEHAHLYHQNQTLEDIINFLGNQGYEYYINDSDIVGILK